MLKRIFVLYLSFLVSPLNLYAYEKFKVNGEVLHYNTELAVDEIDRGIKEEDADKLLKTLKNNPNIKTIHLTSWGGLISTAVEMADIIIDFELGTKITGSGFPVYKGKGAKLQRALISFFLDSNIDFGYHEVQVPYLVNESSAFGTGQLPDKEGQMYSVPQDNLFLIPTAEVPITNIFRDEIIEEFNLPILKTGYSPCFRREAGSYGAHVRGLNRLHQFDKVEIVRVEHPEKSMTP